MRPSLGFALDAASSADYETIQTRESLHRDRLRSPRLAHPRLDQQRAPNPPAGAVARIAERASSLFRFSSHQITVVSFANRSVVLWHA